MIRLHLSNGVEFSGQRAEQRMRQEGWDTLDDQVASLPNDNERIWDGDFLDTDDEQILEYCVSTLLRSFLDGKSHTELKTANPIEPSNTFAPTVEEIGTLDGRGKGPAIPKWLELFPWSENDPRVAKLHQIFVTGMEQRTLVHPAWLLYQRMVTKELPAFKRKKKKTDVPWYVTNLNFLNQYIPSWGIFREAYLILKSKDEKEPNCDQVISQVCEIESSTQQSRGRK